MWKRMDVLVVHLYHKLYFHGLSAGKGSHTYGCTGVPSPISEDFNHQVREPINYTGLLRKGRVTIDHPQHLDNALYFPEIS